MIAHIRNILQNERLVLLTLGGISAASLAMAYIAQYAYGLQPCVLCIYQRIPFALVVAFAVLGLLTGKYPRLWLGLSALALAANSVIASYHTGVERKWWPSFLEGCTIPEMKGDITDVLAQIQAAPVVRCDEIPWTDPVLGLSMANYNVALCLALALFAALACCKKMRGA